MGSTARGLESDPRCGRAVCWLGVDPWLREPICPGVDRGQVPRASPGDEGDLSKAATGNRCCLQAGRSQRKRKRCTCLGFPLTYGKDSFHSPRRWGETPGVLLQNLSLHESKPGGWIINRHPSNERAPPPILQPPLNLLGLISKPVLTQVGFSAWSEGMNRPARQSYSQLHKPISLISTLLLKSLL